MSDVVVPASDNHLLVVAAEHSGDEHAARAVRELQIHCPGVRVTAFGGPALGACGVDLLQDVTTHSAVGFAALSKFSYFRRLIADILDWVEQHRPRAICFVDSSGLNLRIAKALYERGLSVKGGGATKAIYYISPQIWASRARRRFDMAKHLDGLAVIFPFEPACYADTSLPVQFVGHPFVVNAGPPLLAYDPSAPVLLLPGSRRQAVTRNFPILMAAYRAYRDEGGDREAVVIYPSSAVRDAIERADSGPYRLARAGERVAASAVLTLSGTMSLRCALAGIPGAIVYRTDPFTYIAARWLVTVPFLGIANLLLGEPMYPEFIQGAAVPGALAAQLRTAIDDSERIRITRVQAERLQALLSEPAEGNVGEWLARHIAS